ncbi:MAG: hypothetical protein J0H68_08170 [Sphingobacteriia bacterium]|nr:hypothetical protein [Sphingobacteriia bacterium]
MNISQIINALRSKASSVVVTVKPIYQSSLSVFTSYLPSFGKTVAVANNVADAVDDAETTVAISESSKSFGEYLSDKDNVLLRGLGKTITTIHTFLVGDGLRNNGFLTLAGIAGLLKIAFSKTPKEAVTNAVLNKDLVKVAGTVALSALNDKSQAEEKALKKLRTDVKVAELKQLPMNLNTKIFKDQKIKREESIKLINKLIKMVQQEFKKSKLEKPANSFKKFYRKLKYSDNYFLSAMAVYLKHNPIEFLVNLVFKIATFAALPFLLPFASRFMPSRYMQLVAAPIGYKVLIDAVDFIQKTAKKVIEAKTRSDERTSTKVFEKFVKENAVINIEYTVSATDKDGNHVVKKLTSGDFTALKVSTQLNAINQIAPGASNTSIEPNTVQFSLTEIKLATGVAKQFRDKLATIDNMNTEQAKTQLVELSKPMELAF